MCVCKCSAAFSSSSAHPAVSLGFTIFLVRFFACVAVFNLTIEGSHIQSLWMLPCDYNGILLFIRINFIMPLSMNESCFCGRLYGFLYVNTTLAHLTSSGHSS